MSRRPAVRCRRDAQDAEKFDKAPAKVKAGILKLIAMGQGTFTVTGSSLGADHNSATLRIVRHSTMDTYDVAGNRIPGKSRPKDYVGVVKFVRVGKEWKISSNTES